MYLLKIGNIDGITPRVVKVFEELKDHFCIITTARAVPLTASFAWPFEKVELASLTRPDSLKMIYKLIGDLPVGDLDGAMTRLRYGRWQPAQATGAVRPAATGTVYQSGHGY